jgi:hypothetical protein
MSVNRFTSAKAAFLHQGQPQQPMPKQTSGKAAVLHQGQGHQPPSQAASALAAMRANHALSMQLMLKRAMAGKLQADITPVPTAYRPYVRFIDGARDVGYVVSHPQVAGLSRIKEYNLFREWHEGYGPEYRIFLDEHPMTKDMQDAYGVQEARRLFYRKYAKEWGAGKNITNGSVTEYRAGFGPKDLIRSGLNLTQQFVGNNRIDLYNIEGGRYLLFCVTDYKSRNSFYYHIQDLLGPITPTALLDRRRVLKTPDPESNTYQLYMWKERNIYYLNRP